MLWPAAPRLRDMTSTGGAEVSPRRPAMTKMPTETPKFDA